MIGAAAFALSVAALMVSLLCWHQAEMARRKWAELLLLFSTKEDPDHG